MLMTPSFRPRSRPTGDLVEALSSCHDKIRIFLAGLDRIVSLPDLGDPRVPEAAAQARRYFAEGLPLHADDEDLSLAPRLRLAVPASASLMDDLARDHEAIHACLATLVIQLDALAQGRQTPHSVLRATVTLLSGLLLPHIEREEAELFPMCAQLSTADRRAISREIVARRA